MGSLGDKDVSPPTLRCHMIMTIGILLTILGSVISIIWADPHTYGINPGEIVGAAILVVGIASMIVSVGILAWTHLP